jgi:hypothetical protein
VTDALLVWNGLVADVIDVQRDPAARGGHEALHAGSGSVWSDNAPDADESIELATILVTDLVGSTEFANAVGAGGRTSRSSANAPLTALRSIAAWQIGLGGLSRSLGPPP